MASSDWRPLATPDTLRERAKILRSLRHYLDARGVLEVQTPMIGQHTVTDPDVQAIVVDGYGYLQTSAEYFMKRLLMAGVGDCYQMAPVFRHEENGRLHSSEFTMLEWYRVGMDASELMEEVASLCDCILGAAEYGTLDYDSLVGHLKGPRDELDLAFAEACAGLKGRWFIVNYPADQAALARVYKDRPDYAARFELVIDGVEIANGYWELTDPAIHRDRFAADLQERQARSDTLPQVDESFLTALEHGLPDCSGVAVGVDRLVMLALGFDAVREVMTFSTPPFRVNKH